MHMQIIAILGAPDPEMEAIRGLLGAAGIETIQATADGRPVHPGSAYRADPVTVPDGATVWLVECEPGAAHGSGEVVVIDHHRPGDPGYGRPPETFLSASSIGQVVALLASALRLPDAWPRGRTGEVPAAPGTMERCPSGWAVHMPVGGDEDMGLVAMIPTEMVMAAAADHSLGAAYRGECPGVDPDELMRWRAASRAEFQGRSVAEVLANVEAAQRLLADADIEYLPLGPAGGSDIDYVEVHDMRRPEPIPELPEAAMRIGASYISGPLITPDGREKFTCSGTPDVIQAFIDQWAPAEGLVDTYGDPARGFAGGYIP